jgi:uncharacterized protein (DUF2147 family)
MLHCPRNFTRNIVKPALVLSVFLQATCVTAALAADPTGDWRVSDGVANIRVARCGNNLWGVVAWEKEPGGRDSNNPDASKRNRPTLGMPILLDMKKDAGADSWQGQVYNAKDGQTYSSSITPTDANHLAIRGCVLGFLCGGETWTRVGPPIASSPANSMAKINDKINDRNIASAPKTSRPAGSVVTAANGPANTAAKGHGQPTDQVGDICLLPDVARLAH